MQAVLARLTALLPRTAALHATLQLCLCAWFFGGNDLATRPALLVFGSLSLPLTLLALLSEPTKLGRRLLFLAPFVLFCLLVLASCLNPSLRAVRTPDGLGYVPGAFIRWLPTCALPGETLAALWKFAVPYLCGINLLLCVDSRRLLRLVLGIIFFNTVCLALMGSIQKLAGSEGLFFGRVPSVNSSFFASFIYHNHWGAFALLSLGCGGSIIAWVLANAEDLRRSSLPLLLLGVLLIAVAVPLSGSRSCTFMLCAAAASLMLVIAWRQRRLALRPRILIPSAAAVLALGLAVGWLSYPILEPRLRQTQSELTRLYEEGSIGSRATLYHDTAHMAGDRLLLGWGLGSYPSVFYRYNTQTAVDKLPVFYADAHSDWLQACAETGLLGCLLLGAMVFLPLLSLFGGEFPGRIASPPLLACLLIATYAWLEFPFGNLAVCCLWWLCFFTGVRYQQLCSRY